MHAAPMKHQDSLLSELMHLDCITFLSLNTIELSYEDLADNSLCFTVPVVRSMAGK